jgi:signal transduction histidine kinase
MMTADEIRAHVARHLDEQRTVLTARWLELLRARLPEPAHRIFPDDTLLNHIPEVLRAIARSLAESDRPPGSGAAVRDEMRKLAELRRAQGYAVDEIVGEFDVLQSLLFECASDAVRDLPPAAPADVLEVAARLCDHVGWLGRHTAAWYSEAAAEERRRRNQVLSEFGRSVTHELRNRLGNCTLLLQHVREVWSRDPESAEHSLARLDDQLRRLASVVRDVYAVSAAHLGNVDEGEWASLSSLVAEILDDLRDLAEAERVELRCGDLPPVVVDAPRVQVVLVNLLTNAVKYADPRKSDRWVSVTAARSGEREWQVEVADNGVGIPADHHERIFSDGARGDAADGVDGEGLGLALAQRAVTSLGGRIWVESEPGEGSRFTFTLSEPPEEIAR